MGDVVRRLHGILHASVEKAAMQCECHPISRLSSRLPLASYLPDWLRQRNAESSSADSVNNCPPGLLWYVMAGVFYCCRIWALSKRLQPTLVVDLAGTAVFFLARLNILWNCTVRS